MDADASGRISSRFDNETSVTRGDSGEELDRDCNSQTGLEEVQPQSSQRSIEAAAEEDTFEDSAAANIENGDVDEVRQVAI